MVLAIALGSAVAVAGIAMGVIFLSGPPAPNGVAFLAAGASGASALHSLLNGSWELAGGAGVEQPTPSTVSLSNGSSLLGPNCTISLLPGAPPSGQLTIPAYHGPFTTGLAPFWLLLYESPSGDSFAVVAVVEGAPSPLATLSGANCSLTLAGVTPLPSGAVDSPVAARAAWAASGSGWVAADPGLTTLTMVAVGSGTFMGFSFVEVWLVQYAPCSPFTPGSVHETAFTDVLNLTTAGLVTSLPTATTCPA